MGSAHSKSLNKIKRGVDEIVPKGKMEEKLETAEKEERPLRIKLGVDPSSPDLTLGHAVVLKKMRDFQDLGHIAVLVVGDFTRRIGDPTGRSNTRSTMTAQEIDENMTTYEKQVFHILDPEKTEIRYNSEWLGKLTFEDIIDLTSKYTVARMLERNDFSKRFSNNKPISILEFLYPLAQAYDSVAIDADVEVGGSDQRFNMLIGRHIQEEFDQPPQAILTMPLIEGTDGEKAMSQTTGNYIGINEAPEQVFGKIMSLPDKLMDKYFLTLTNTDPDQFKDLHPKKKKKKLASEIVSEIYSEVEARHAQEEFEQVFEEKGKPSEMKEIEISTEELKEDGTIWIVDLVDKTGFVSSRSEARRVIEQGGVKLNDEKVETVDFDPPLEEGTTIQIGKTNFGKIKISD